MAVAQPNIKTNYRIIGVFSSASAYLADIGSGRSATEGDIYYNTSTNRLMAYDGSTWVAQGGGASIPLSLDGSAQVGAKITNVDQVEIERSYASGAILVLDQNNTGASASCLALENASADSSGITVDFTSAAGYDIDGTGSSWTVGYQGNASFNQLNLADDKSLRFGSAQDITMTWDQTKLVFSGAAANNAIHIGDETNLDLVIFGDTTTDAVTFDTSAEDVQFNGFDLTLQDADILNFGDNDDITMRWDATQFKILAAAGGSDLHIGAAATNIDTFIYGDLALDGATAGYDIQWDRSENTLEVLDNVTVAFGTGDDVTMMWDATKFNLLAAAADTTFHIGGATNGFDITYYFETAGTISTDYDADVLTFNACDLALGDDDYILLGDSASAGGTTDGTIRWDSSNDNIEIIGNVDITGTLTVSGAFDIGNFAFGDDEELRFGNSNDFVFQYDSSTANMAIDAAAANDGIDIGSTVATDVIFHGTNAGRDVTWDSSADSLIFADSAELVFGTGSDITIAWDQTRLNITGSGSQIRFGADDEGVDVLFYGETASAQMLWDESADQLVVAGGAQISLNDDVELLFGTGSSNAGDFSIASDGTSLSIAEISSAGKAVNVGVSGKGLDFNLYGDDAGRDCYWDQSANQLELKDDALLAFGSADDITMTWDQTKLVISGAAADSAIHIGDATNLDLVIYGGTTTNAITFDTDDSALTCTFNGFDLYLDDDDVLAFGDDQDMTITYDQSKLLFHAAAGDDEINFGGDGTNLDVRFCGATTSNDILFDCSDEQLEFNGIDILICDDDILKFGDAGDITITYDQSKLLFHAAAGDDEINFGGDGTNIDVRFCGATTSNDILFDCSDERLEFNGIDLHLMDDDILIFGDATNDVQMYWDQTQMQIVPSGNIFIGDKTNYVTISSSGVLTADATGNDFGSLCIPQHATSSPSGTPGTGAIFFEVDASKLWVHKGSGSWIGTVLS